MGADDHREALGFLSVWETAELAAEDVKILDPGSTMVSRHATLGAGTVIYPGVIIDADETAKLTVGEGCVLYPSTLLEARQRAQIVIAGWAELGPGGVSIRATGGSSSVVLEPDVRLSGGCELSGTCVLGRGAQILGPIAARSVQLGGGRGGHRWPNPDERGAVLKGAGLAEGISLKQGEVRSARPSFSDVPTERQAAHHPRRR
jgi:bifunctional N-acetylglucosamine-1-phosphate-uridyltransferase/glucosamine-1-phosphate-acetyltransferase GlmU-like protein